jgi:hypothetical protein
VIIIPLPKREYWDEANQRFVYIPQGELVLNHSLNSLRKWESIHHKPFLSREEKTKEEILDYIKCMTINEDVGPEVYEALSPAVLKRIQEYINDPMTATTIRRENQKRNNEIITAEIIYYWMVALQITESYRKWHLNQLLTLILVCNIKNEPPKKQNKGDIMRNNAALNAARRKKFNTKG